MPLNPDHLSAYIELFHILEGIQRRVDMTKAKPRDGPQEKNPPEIKPESPLSDHNSTP